MVEAWCFGCLSGPPGFDLFDFFCSGIQFYLLLSPCFISFLYMYLDLYIYLLDFFCSGIQFYLLLSPCFISFLYMYLDLYIYLLDFFCSGIQFY